MSDEKMQTGAEYRITAEIPGYYYKVSGNSRGGEIIFTMPSWRLEMEDGGKKIVSDVQELLKILPKNEGEEIVISEKQLRKYTEVKVTPDGGEELTFVTELGCNCGSCDRGCHLKYDGEIVVLDIDGEERYFAK